MAKKKKKRHNNKQLAVSEAHHSDILVNNKTTVSIGPLPTADELKKYELVREDLPDLFIETWQKNSDVRRETMLLDAKTRSMLANTENTKTGAVVIFLICMMAIAIYFITEGRYDLATTIMVAPFAAGILNSLFKKE